MPHSSKKHKRVGKSSGNRRTTYVIIIVIIAIIAAAGGWYAYASFRSISTTPTTSTTFASQVITTVVTVGSSAVTLTEFQSGSTLVIYAKIFTSETNTASNGVMGIELFPQSAPKTVANFVNLARLGFYNNLVWHRIVKGFVIQTGDPNTRNGGGDRTTWGSGGSSTTVPLEIDPNLLNDVGYLGMARSSDPNSGSSQFYINLGNNTSLNGQYTVFGKVISGMDVANAIANVSVETIGGQPEPVTPVYVTSIQILNGP